MKRKISILLLFIITFCIHANNQDLTYDQYLAELKSAIYREEEAKRGIATEQANIETVKNNIKNTKRAYSRVRNEIDELPGCSPELVSEWFENVNRISEILSEITELSGLELIAKQNELNKLRNELNKAAALNAALLTDNDILLQSAYSTITETEDLIIQAQEEDRLAKMQPAVQEIEEEVIEEEIIEDEEVSEQETVNTTIEDDTEVTVDISYDSYDSYTVKDIPGNAECLWTIAGYTKIYNNSNLWRRIYESNKEVMNKNFAKFSKRFPGTSIQRPQDLIYPGQKLRIPRENPKY